MVLTGCDDGTDGSDGLPLLMETAKADNCMTSGITYTFGYDTHSDGVIDVVTSEETICNEVASEVVVDGAAVLYFADDVSASGDGDVLIQGFENLENEGLISLAAADSDAEFRSMLKSGDYDVAVYFAQSHPLGEEAHDALVDWVERSGRLIFGTYTESSDNGLFSSLQSSFSGSNGHNRISFTTTRSSYKLPDDMELFTDPWVTHSVGLNAHGTAHSIGEFEDGDSFAVLGNGGRTLHLGVFSDVYPEMHVNQIALNVLATVLVSGY